MKRTPFFRFPFLAVFAGAALLVSACASPAASAPSATSAVKSAAAAKPLVVGMEVNYAPFNWMQTDGKNGGVKIDGAAGFAAGYDVEIAKRLAESVGRTLVVKQIAWDGLVPALQSGSVDLIVAGMSQTPERAKTVAFTKPYYESSFVMLVKKDSPFAKATSLGDFKGARVVGQKDTNYNAIITQISGANHLTPLASVPLIVNAIQSGVADATPVEKPVGISVTAANPSLVMVQFAPDKGFQPMEGVTTAVSVALRKEDAALLEAVDKALANISPAQREQLMSEAVKNQPAGA